MVCVFVAFIRMVYGRTIYMSLPRIKVLVACTSVDSVDPHK